MNELSILRLESEWKKAERRHGPDSPVALELRRQLAEARAEARKETPHGGNNGDRGE